jgi:hypothetical protein
VKPRAIAGHAASDRPPQAPGDHRPRGQPFPMRNSQRWPPAGPTIRSLKLVPIVGRLADDQLPQAREEGPAGGRPCAPSSSSRSSVGWPTISSHKLVFIVGRPADDQLPPTCRDGRPRGRPCVSFKLAKSVRPADDHALPQARPDRRPTCRRSAPTGLS